MPSRFTKLRARLRSIPLDRVVLFGGIALIGGGVALHDIGYGLTITGIVLLLSLKPLFGWVK